MLIISSTDAYDYSEFIHNIKSDRKLALRKKRGLWDKSTIHDPSQGTIISYWERAVPFP
jgi:hypothetical protein